MYINKGLKWRKILNKLTKIIKNHKFISHTNTKIFNNKDDNIHKSEDLKLDGRKTKNNTSTVSELIKQNVNVLV